MKHEVISLSGARVGEVDLQDAIFARKPNPSLLSQYLRVYESALHAGLSGKTKTRAQVSGGGIKPRPQKGSGKSRQGSIRSPLWVGGGVTHGPQPNRVLKLPRKMRQQALSLALSARNLADSLIVLEEAPRGLSKTKDLVKLLESFKGKSFLLVLAQDDPSLRQLARNLSWLSILPVQSLSAFMVLRHPDLLMTKEALAHFGVASASVFTEKGEDDLETLGLSTRPLNALRKAGITSAQDVKQMSEESLSEIDGLGKGSIAEILKLKEH